MVSIGWVPFIELGGSWRKEEEWQIDRRVAVKPKSTDDDVGRPNGFDPVLSLRFQA